MFGVEFPYCCGLRVIVETDVLGEDNAFSRKEAEKLNNIGIAESVDFAEDYSTAGILTITDIDRDEFKRATTFLTKKGWKLLGSIPGAHQEEIGNGKYKIYLYGSKEFKRPLF
jgi:hypothetical protein